MYQAIAFFDLDGTLLNDQSEITPEISQTMLRLKENNILPIISTGRCEFEIQAIKKAAHIDASITMNGMYGIYENDTIFSNKIDITTCQKMLDFTRKLKHEVAFYSHETMFISGVNQLVKDSYQYFNNVVPPIKTDAFLEYETNMLLVLTDELDELYHEAFADELTFFRNGPKCIDVVNKGISKGTAIDEVKNFLQQDIPTFTFGDGLNDLPMFESSDYQIAMGNALPEVKSAASFISTKNTEHGIINGLKHYDLI